MITTVIFDLDGLLADTERLHCRAYQTALLEHGVSLRGCEKISRSRELMDVARSRRNV